MISAATRFDYQEFERAAISGLLSGKSLLLLKGQMSIHIDSEKEKGIVNQLNALPERVKHPK